MKKIKNKNILHKIWSASEFSLWIVFRSLFSVDIFDVSIVLYLWVSFLESVNLFWSETDVKSKIRVIYFIGGW